MRVLVRKFPQALWALGLLTEIGASRYCAAPAWWSLGNLKNFSYSDSIKTNLTCKIFNLQWCFQTLSFFFRLTLLAVLGSYAGGGGGRSTVPKYNSAENEKVFIDDFRHCWTIILFSALLYFGSVKRPSKGITTVPKINLLFSSAKNYKFSALLSTFSFSALLSTFSFSALLYFSTFEYCPVTLCEDLKLALYCFCRVRVFNSS